MNYFYVHGLYSIKYDKIYVGRTSNIKARLQSHYYSSQKGFTSRYRPWKLIYLEKCLTKVASIQREHQLKSAQGRLFIRSRIVEK